MTHNEKYECHASYDLESNLARRNYKSRLSFSKPCLSSFFCLLQEEASEPDGLPLEDLGGKMERQEQSNSAPMGNSRFHMV